MNSKHKTLLVVGATSDIGRATALHYAENGWRIMLAARDVAAAQRNASDIATRTGVEVSTYQLDILEPGNFAGFIDALPELPDTVVCVVGELGDQARAEKDFSHAIMVLRTNFEGPALLLGLFAEKFLARGTGAIVGVSSVAGDRGRASNYVYGSAKGGFTAFLSGLRNRLARSRVRVITIKPGFVRTRMTKGMKLPAFLTVEPRAVAVAIYKSDEGARNVVYVSPVWRVIMLIIGSIPESIFKRLRL